MGQKSDSYTFSRFLKVFSNLYPFSAVLEGASIANLPYPWISSAARAVFLEPWEGDRSCLSGFVKMTSYHCRQRGESLGAAPPERSYLRSKRGGVHSLVKISSFSGKKCPFPSCVLRKFLLSCVHTSSELSDGNITGAGIIWYDVSGNSQCLTTPGDPG